MVNSKRVSVYRVYPFNIFLWEVVGGEIVFDNMTDERFLLNKIEDNNYNTRSFIFETKNKMISNRYSFPISDSIYKRSPFKKQNPTDEEWGF